MENEIAKKQSVRDEFAKKFISLLESDKPLEWIQGWSQHHIAPYNGGSGRHYKGINRLALGLTALEKGWDDPRFYTYKQASDLGYKIKSGQHASRVEFWMVWDSKEKKSITLQEMKKILGSDTERNADEFNLFAKSAFVFNAAQIDGLAPLPEREHVFEENKLAEEVIKVLQDNMEVPVHYEGDQAYYSPKEDSITLPPKSSFFSSNEFYGTALHEFAHATGHPTRLNRPLDSFRTDSDSYSIEELRAEIASTFVCGELDVKMPESVVNNHLAYVQHWLTAIKKDHNVLFEAVKDADAITDYLLDKGRVDIMREKIETFEKEPKGLVGKQIEIWQLSDKDYNDAIAFAGYGVASQYSLTSSRYDKVWQGISEDETLEDIYYRLNVSRPDGYTGRSMSVSDVVVIKDESGSHAFYCDIVGFKELVGFVKEPLTQSIARAL